MRSGKTAILHFLSQVARSIAGFLATFFIARYLGAAPLGIYAQALTLLFWLKFPTDSVGKAISKRMSEDDAEEGLLLSGVAMAFAYCVGITTALILGRGYVNAYVGGELALFLAILLVSNVLFDTTIQALVGVGNVAISGWLGTVERVFRLFGQVALVLGGLAVLGLVLGHALSLIIVSFVGVYLLKDHLQLPTRSSFRSVASFAQYSWLGSLRSNALNWMDILVLGFFVADSLIGIYQVTWTLASFLAIAGSSIATTLFPKMSSLSTRDQFDEINQLLDEGLVFVGIFLIPGFFGAIVIGDEILKIYRPEFAQGTEILAILVAARGLNLYGQQFVNTLNGIDRPELSFRINAIFLATNLLLNVGLVLEFGWYGAAFATLISSGTYLVLGYLYLTSELGNITIPIVEIMFEIAASIVMIGFVWILLEVLPENHYVTIAITLTGAAIYGIVLFGLSGRIRDKTLSFV